MLGNPYVVQQPEKAALSGGWGVDTRSPPPLRASNELTKPKMLLDRHEDGVGLREGQAGR